MLVEIALVYFTYPETKGVTLEEVSIIFDGKHAVHNDLLVKQEEAEDATTVTSDDKGITVERRELSPTEA